MRKITFCENNSRICLEDAGAVRRRANQGRCGHEGTALHDFRPRRAAPPASALGLLLALFATGSASAELARPNSAGPARPTSIASAPAKSPTSAPLPPAYPGRRRASARRAGRCLSSEGGALRPAGCAGPGTTAAEICLASRLDLTEDSGYFKSAIRAATAMNDAPKPPAFWYWINCSDKKTGEKQKFPLALTAGS